MFKNVKKGWENVVLCKQAGELPAERELYWRKDIYQTRKPTRPPADSA